MSYYSFFNRLPPELLHTLFDYFSAHELFLTFSNITDYVNSVLHFYSSYRLDLKSIQKIHLDLVCRHIRPEQVISLTLSDADDTPGQSELFFSVFRIEQFTRLRSLRLIKIEYESLKFIFFNLSKLDQLRSLSFDRSIRYQYPYRIIPDHYHQANVNIKVLSQSNRLNLNNGVILKFIPLSHIRHLKLGKCSSNELKTIFEHASQLKSLNVCVDIQRSNFELILSPNQLTQLSLEIENYHISKDEMQQLLSQFPHLKYLELKANVLIDLADGYEWQILAMSLITFYFKFNVSHLHGDDILNSFRTPFWLEEKRWYVACHNEYLFSLPHFTPDHIDSVNLSDFYSTAPDHFIIYNHLNKFTIDTILINHKHRFTHIKTLEIRFPTSLQILESVIDLNQVEHLIVSSLDDLFKLIPLERAMRQLYKLTVIQNITTDMIKQNQYNRFEQIRKLEISISEKEIDYIIEELFRLFPCIQHLIYKSPIQSKQIMVDFIDRFTYLLNASFFTDSSFSVTESSFCRDSNTIIQHSRRLIKNNFTCQIYHSSIDNLSYDIHWWMEP